MITMTFINDQGDRLDLSSNPLFHLFNADGLTDVQASLATSTMPTMDMTFVNNASVYSRTIGLDLRVKSGANAEKAKRAILSVVKPKREGTLVLEFPDRVQQITGIVEAIHMPRFVNDATMSIDLFCTSPFWEDASTVEDTISEDIDMHYWGSDQLYFIEDGIVLGEYSDSLTRSFWNHGDVSVGMTIKIIATAPVSNPMIYNTQNNEFIQFNVTMEAGDELVIDTRKGKKSALLNGQNVLDSLVSGSTFIQMDVGEQEFTLTNDEDGKGAYFAISYNQKYV